MAKKKRLKKCALGTKYLQDPTLELQKHFLMQDQAKIAGMQSPLAAGIDTANMLFNIYASNQHMFPLGGNVQNQVGVEVEGEEVAQAPDGTAQLFKGPDHAQGGIKTSLPEGTDIYSKRIEKFGKTIAKRKEERLKKIKKIEGLLKKTPHDEVLLNSLNRLQQDDDKLSEEDMAMQEQIKNVFGIGEQGEQMFPLGGKIPYPEFDKNKVPGITDMQIDSNNVARNIGTPVDIPTPGQNTSSGIAQGFSMPNINLKGVGENISGTPGDYMAMTGNLIAGLAPLQTTMANRAKDIPHENLYKDFGKESLKTLETAFSGLASQRESMLKDLQSLKSSTVQDTRRNARGINTKRAIDLFSEQELNKREREINQAFTEQMMNLMLGKADTQMKAEQVQLQGLDTAQMKNRQDLDTFYRNLGQDKSRVGTTIATIGKQLNEQLSSKRDKEILQGIFDESLDITTITMNYQKLLEIFNLASTATTKELAEAVEGASEEQRKAMQNLNK